MIKVIVKDLSLAVTNEAVFPTEAEADAWILEKKEAGAFGKKGGWYNESQLSELEKQNAIETAVVKNPFIAGDDPGEFNIYKIADAFTIEKVDITVEVQKENRFVKGKRNQEFGASIIAQVYGINDEKIASGAFTQQQLSALLADVSLAQIERFLFNGSIGTAKLLIQGLDNTFYTSQERQFIIGLIDEYLA